jgi:phage terminase large subunit-like protein
LVPSSPSRQFRDIASQGDERPSPAVLDDLLAFAKFVGVELYNWQADAFGAACKREGGRFVHRLAAVSVPRGNGKSYMAALIGTWRLLCGPAPQDILGAALDADGARIVFDHAKSIIKKNPALASAIEIQAGALIVKSTGSRWTITSREHTASRGRHATLVIYDEASFARGDDLFSSLLAGQASIDDPLMLVVTLPPQTGPA